MKILFLTLKVFSATGGIEKVCRVMGKALYEQGLEAGNDVQIMSMHDDAGAADGNRYFPAEIFYGYGAAKAKFILAAVEAGSKSDTVILSHINLLIAAWLIKKISPATNVILLAHGIEIWYPLPKRRVVMLNTCDKIVSVSRYTCSKITEVHGIHETKCTVLNNCLDPFIPKSLSAPNNVRGKYGFTNEDIVLFTLTRISTRDRYKGYQHVLTAMSMLIKENPRLRYIIAGSSEPGEEKFVTDKIQSLDLTGKVVLTGFVAEEDLPAHFLTSDIYVMPSMKEGFGIVFIEAMFYGLPVIAGNADGSADALLGGKLGLLIEPDGPEEIASAIKRIIENKKRSYPGS